jgi:hypothetical protein
MVFNYITRYIFRVPIHDVGWTKMVKKSVIDKIDLKRTGAIVELELIVKAALCGFLVYEVTVPYVSRCSGRSKCFNIGTLISSFISLSILCFEVAMINVNKRAKKACRL